MKHKRHDDEECELVKKVPDKNPERWLTVLRVLRLRKSQPELWQKFLLLEDHLEDRKECPLMTSNKANVWNVLKTYLPAFVDGLDLEDILRICGILDSNSFRIDKHGTRGLFLATSMVNHDCLPNARVVFDHSGEVVVKAKKAISQGQTVSITYCSLLTNTETRLSKLKKSKFFTCGCDLCADPTEKSTFMSALICPKCKGHLLPASFHDPQSPWTCQKCTFSTTREKVDKLVEAVRNSYTKISTDPRTVAKEKVPELEAILAKRSGSVLPSSHQILMDLKQDLANLYDTNPNLDVSKRIEFVKERLELIEKLEGQDTDSRLKGFLLFRLHNLLVAKVAQMQRKGVVKDLKEIGTEIGFCLTESARILRLDQGCPPQLIETITSLSNNGFLK